MTADGFTLAPDYLSNFYVHNEDSPENIFIIPLDKHLYKSQFQYLFRSRHYAHGGAFGTSSENGASATVSTVRTFGYGTNHVDNRYAYNLYSDTVRVDGNIIRLENGQPLVYVPLAVEPTLTNSPYIKTAGARMAKYEVDRTAFNDGKSLDNDIVLFRYADVLLMRQRPKYAMERMVIGNLTSSEVVVEWATEQLPWIISWRTPYGTDVGRLAPQRPHPL